MVTNESAQNDERRKRKILRDGEKLVVAVTMMDSMQRQMFDAGHRPALRHCPGFVGTPANDTERRTAMYDDADRKLSDRWKQPALAIKPDDESEKLSPVEDRTAAYAAHDCALSERWRHAQ